MSTVSLSSAQRNAVYASGHCLITAMPGSGKTFTLVHRAVHLLTTHPRANLVGVTFTNDAANSLRMRILDAIPSAASRILCGTFHSLCIKQLDTSRLRRRLLDPGQQRNIVRLSCADVEGDSDQPVDLDEAIAAIDQAKSSLEPLFSSQSLRDHRFIYEAYQRRLEQMGACDFADLLIQATRGMLATPPTVSPLPCDFLLVDEYQDVDDIQSAWVQAHIRRGALVTVVGDDDQSIYSFRNAGGIKAMLDFRDTNSATHVELNTTYRCPRNVVAHAGRLIGHNAVRVPKQLQTNNPSDGRIRTRAFAEPDAEVEAIIEAIDLSRAPHHWAILARNNHLLDRIDSALYAAKIPYHRPGSPSPWDEPMPDLFLRLCRSIAFGDIDGLDYLLRMNGVPESELAQIRHRSKAGEPGSLLRFLNDPAIAGLSDPAIRSVRACAAQWRDRLHQWRDDVDPLLGPIAHFVSRHAHGIISNLSPGQVKYNATLLRSCHAAVRSGRGHSLREYLISLREYEERRKKPPSSDEDRIARGAALLTMHKSKGLEFDNVWIIGCRSDILPSTRTSNLEEERRLFYVAMTRTKGSLTLSHCLPPKNMRAKIPRSLFIAEAGL